MVSQIAIHAIFAHIMELEFLLFGYSSVPVSSTSFEMELDSSVPVPSKLEVVPELGTSLHNTTEEMYVENFFELTVLPQFVNIRGYLLLAIGCGWWRRRRILVTTLQFLASLCFYPGRHRTLIFCRLQTFRLFFPRQKRISEML